MRKEPEKPMRLTRIMRFLPAVLLLIHTGLLAYADFKHSPCIDEVGHMAAGLSHWKLGRFDLYHVNPPLVRMVAVVPVLFADPKYNWTAYSEAPGSRSEFELGHDFIAANGERSFWFFTWARWACIPFSLLGGYVCYRWSRELYGEWAGLLALTLWCFDPNILANAQMITPDTGATALGVTAAYVFWKWLKEPSWSLAFLAGLALGAAELTKMTWIVLFALWPLLWLIWTAPKWRRLGMWCGLKQVGQLGIILLIGLFLVNAAFNMEGSMACLGDYHFVSESLGGPPRNRSGATGNRFVDSWLGKLPIPVPREYVLGMDVQKHDFELHYNSYLRGEWRQEGWWYYFLYGLAIKVPLGVWLLALLAAFLGLSFRGYAACWRDEVFILAPLILVLTFVSSQTGFNHHLRYVLPIFPFAFIWTSKTWRVFRRNNRATASTAWLASGAAAWAVASSLWVYPHSLSYFNELVGGPGHGAEHLVDSNIDWGQDLLYLRDWLKQHPEVRPLGLAYFGRFDPRVAGIEFTLPQKGATSPEESLNPSAQEIGPRPGWYAVSVTMMRGYSYSIPDGKGDKHWYPLGSFSYFQRFTPIAHCGWSIYIYRITPQECMKVRAGLGLPELSESAPTP